MCILVSLAIFDILNALRILPYGVEFTHVGRVISTGGVALVLYLIEKLVHQNIGVRLSGYVWMAGTLIVGIDFVGDVLRLYGSWQPYDQFAHFLSGPLLVGALLLALSTIAHHQHWQMPRVIFYLLVLGIDLMVAVLYEIEEYLEDVLTLSHRLGDGPDTVNDILMNLVGGAGLILAIVVYEKAKQKWRTRKTLSIPVRIVTSH